MKKRTGILAAVYDTETTNLEIVENGNTEHRAFPVLFIVNDLRGRRIQDYNSEEDTIIFFRKSAEMLEYIDELIAWGKGPHFPIVAAYNLMFDLQPIIYELSKKYRLRIVGQSSAKSYYVDVCENTGKTLLRFWDTWYLEQNGLAAMGRACGLPKATGDWDYTLIRTQETELTGEELHYAARDVQVIPEYLKWLLKTYSFLIEDDFGNTIFTSSSIVRKMADSQIGRRRFGFQAREVRTADYFLGICRRELPRDYDNYALRRACVRGGLTFTAGEYAFREVRNVVSLDVASMHHLFINGSFVPVSFKPARRQDLQFYADYIVKMKIDDVLEDYYKPFPAAFHAKFRFYNMRLKENSPFLGWGIATLSQSRFSKRAITDFGDNERNDAAETEIRRAGYYDRAKNARFALSKLFSADIAELFISEIELWIIAQVYDFDRFEAVSGELATNWILPPEYVSLQSNKLYEQKRELKKIKANYVEGLPYPTEISPLIQENISKGLSRGEVTASELDNYYETSVKGTFNGIFGSQLMDLFKPDFRFDGEQIVIDDKSKATPENFEQIRDNLKKPAVLYNYGLRIVGGSRLHLVIAISLLWKSFGTRIAIVSGDTDSLKIAVKDKRITDADLLNALWPLHKAATAAIDRAQLRNRQKFADLASSLDDIGVFQIEQIDNAGNTRFPRHFEAWNKARVSQRPDGTLQIVCAGFPRKTGDYSLEDFAAGLLRKGVPFEKMARCIFGFNTWYSSKICHYLERYVPAAADKIQMEITDYTGKTALVDEYQSIALYENGRLLCDLSQKTNLDTLEYLRSKGLKLDSSLKLCDNVNGKACVFSERKRGWKKIC